MRTKFYVREDRIDELKYFIRTKLPSARFIQNPYKYKQGGGYSIYLELEVEDGNKLTQRMNEWYLQDIHIETKVKKSLWNQFISIFKPD